MIVYINGCLINNEDDFHNELSKALNLSKHYGKNLDALWVVLSSDVDRPVTVVW